MKRDLFTTRTPFLRKLGFLLLSFPLGIVYGLSIFTELALSLSRLIIGVGLFIFVQTCTVSDALAAYERQRIAHVLGISLPVRSALPSPRARQQRFLDAVRDPLTWKQVFYLLLAFPLGVISFCLTLALLVGSVGLTLTPLFYFVGTYFLSVLLPAGVIAPGPRSFLSITSTFEIMMFGRSLLVMIVGLLCCVITLLMIRGLMALWGALARKFLSSDVVKQPVFEALMVLMQKDVIR
ncbi:MAG TPA: sensor domain-containing protein [Ktedonobacteraceae bacterium]|nr:sensor domain-containing protein [Ktedonobacteraceae bacterium]